jgi:hypothetical protein
VSRHDANRPGRHLYYGLIPASAIVIASALLLAVRGNAVADSAMILLSVPLLFEGAGLLFNWRGETDEIWQLLNNEADPSLLSVVPPAGFRAFGFTFLVLGCGFLVDGIRYLS